MGVKAKCWVGNYDGLRTGLIVASSQKKAAAVASTSLYTFRQFFCLQANIPNGDFKPETLYTKPANSPYGLPTPWREGRCPLP